MSETPGRDRVTAPPDLDRFVTAQADVYPQALIELKNGRKTSHWMWFVFPQIVGLGRSAMAQHYSIADLAEATAHLGHPVLGSRLSECAEIVLGWAGRRSAPEIFGDIDATKLRSSATLFEAAGGGAIFGDLLDAHFGGIRDPATLTLLDVDRHR